MFKLRNIFYMSATALMTLMVGCSSDDDENNDNGNSNNSDKEVTSATYTLGLSYTDDHLALFDMNVEYTTPSGEKRTEPITGAWSKTVEFTSFPSAFSLTVTQTLKPGVELTKETYKMGATVTEEKRAYNAEGKVLRTINSNMDTYLSIRADQVEQYATKHQKVFNLSFTIKLNADKSDIVITND